jgi:hypothetical protein
VWQAAQSPAWARYLPWAIKAGLGWAEAMPADKKKVRKQFFFEKKNQKTFVSLVPGVFMPAPAGRGF